MQDRDRLGELRLARDRDCKTGRAQRLVECSQWIVDRLGGDRPLRDGDSVRERIGKLRDEASAEQDDSRPCHKPLMAGEASARRFDVGPGGRGQDRRRIGHRGAQVGVVPSLDAARRQSGRGEPGEGGGASG